MVRRHVNKMKWNGCIEMDSIRLASSVSSVSHHGDFTARLLQHEDWQREALRASQERAILRAMRSTELRRSEAGEGQAPAKAGGFLLRIRQRLQNQPRVANAASSAQ
jgi:hypothetical protein